MKFDGEIDDLERAFLPVVAPADDDVASIHIVFMQFEVSTLVFELDADAAKFAVGVFAFGFAIGEIDLDCFDDVTEFAGKAAEEEDDAGFIDGSIAQAIEVDGVAVGEIARHERSR